MMTDPAPPVSGSIADQVAAILARSASEPGINEVITLMNLTAETMQVQQLRSEMTPAAPITQMTSLPPPVAR